MEKVRNIDRRIRIYDEDIWKQIDHIMTANDYRGNFNAAINAALKLGLPRLEKMIFEPAEYYSDTKKENADETARRLRDLMRTVDEIYVKSEIIKYLVASVFNIEAAKLEGLNLTAEMLDSGLMAQLPKNLQIIETEMMKSNGGKR